MKKYLKKIKGFWLKYEAKIVIFLGFLLVSGISFEAGILQGQKWQQKPLVIEKQIDTAQAGEIAKAGSPGALENTPVSQPITQTLEPKTSSSCTYVGSKNSTKFYLSTCSWAKKIKPENLVCFPGPEEALKQGRTESKCN